MSKPRPKRRVLRVVAALFGVGLALVLVAVVLLPTIGGALAPGAIADSMSESVNGRVEIDRVRLAWFGGQSVEGLRVFDPSGKEVIDIDVTSDTTTLDVVLGALGGDFDLGGVTVGGSVLIEIDENGKPVLAKDRVTRQTSITRTPTTTTTTTTESREASAQDKLKEAGDVLAEGVNSASVGGEFYLQLPPSMRTRLTIDDLDLRVVDAREGGFGDIGFDSLSGEAVFSVSEGSVFEAGTVLTEGGASAGGVAIEMSADGFFDSEGTLEVDAGTARVAISVADASVAVLERVFGDTLREAELAEGALTEGLGDTLTVSVIGEGGTRGGTLSAAVMSDGFEFDAVFGADVADDVVRVTSGRELRLKVAAELLRAFGVVPADLAEAGVDVTTLPDVTMAMGALSAAVPMGDGVLPDLGGVSFDLAVTTTEVVGTVSDPDGGEGQVWSLEPAVVSVSSGALRDGVSIRLDGAAALDGSRAGGIEVDLLVGGLLDGDGQLRDPLSASIDGVLLVDVDSIDRLEPLLSPVLADSGAVLHKAIGDSLRVRVEAEASDDDGLTRVSLDVESENITANGAMEVGPSRVRTVGDGVVVRVASVSSAAGSMLSAAGVTVDEGSGFEATLAGVDIDLDAVLAGDETISPDAVLQGSLGVELSRTTGVVALEERTERFEIDGFRLRADLRDLVTGGSINGGGSLALGGKNAGTLRVEAHVMDLLRALDADEALLPRVDGTLSLSGLSGSLLGVVDPSFGDLGSELGDEVEVFANAKSVQDGAAIRFSTGVTTAAFTATAGARLEGKSLLSDGKGVQVNVPDLGSLLAALPVAEDVDGQETLRPEVLPGGSVTLRVRSFEVPLDGETIDVARVSADASVDVEGVRVRGADGRSVAILNRLGVGFEASGEGDASVDVNGSLVSGTDRAVIGGSIGVTELAALGKSGLPRAEGRLDVTGLPASLAGVFAQPMPAGDREIALHELASGVVGERFDLAMVFEPVGDGTRATVEVGGAHADVFTAVEVVGDVVSLERLELNLDAPDGGVNRTLALLGQEARVRGPVSLSARAEPTVLMRGGAIVGESELVASVVVSGSVVAESGVIGTEGVSLNARVPLAGVDPKSANAGPFEASFDMGGELRDGTGQVVGSVEGSGSVGLLAAKPSGEMDAQLRVSGIDSGVIDSLLALDGGLDGAVAGALGATLGVDIDVDGSFVDGASEQVRVRVSPESPRLRTVSAIGVELADDVVRLTEPGTLVWTLDPDFGTRVLLGQEPGAEQIRLAGSSEVTVRLDSVSLAVPVSEDSGAESGMEAVARGVLHPDSFAIGATLDVPALSMVLADGTRTGLSALRGELDGDGSGPLTLVFTGAGVDGGESGLDARVVVSSFADGVGTPTPEKAVVDATVDAPMFPTAMVDAIAKQNGLLVDLLGPAIALDLDAESLSKQDGVLSAEASSERSLATLDARIAGGVLRTTEPIVIRQAEVTAELGARLVAGIPVLETVEKRLEDGPAEITISGLSVPTSGENPIAGLNCDFRADLGRARFRTSEAFAPLLDVAKLNRTGELGGRVSMLTGRVRSGVMVYDRVTVPLGEFEISSEGTVDLVKREMNVLTRVPLGALAGEGLAALPNAMGSREREWAQFGLNAGSQIPFRATGPLDKPRVEVDTELFAREFTENLVEDLIEKEGEKLLRRLFGG